MPRISPFAIVMSSQEPLALEEVARKYTSPYRDVVRTKVVLYAARGLQNKEIASRIDVPRQIVSKWRKRFAVQPLLGKGSGGIQAAVWEAPGRPAVKQVVPAPSAIELFRDRPISSRSATGCQPRSSG
jgi:transposase-like protein